MTTLPQLDANDWSTLAPHYTKLLAESLHPETIQLWLTHWSDLDKQVWEARAWHKRAKSRDATDADAQAAWQRFSTAVFSPFQEVSRQLKNKLLVFDDWQPKPEQRQFLRRLQNEADFSSCENVSIETGIVELQGTYFNIIGGVTTIIDGQELTIAQAEQQLLSLDHTRREVTWRSVAHSWQQHRTSIDEIFVALIRERRRLAHSIGLSDYRDIVGASLVALITVRLTALHSMA